MTKLNAQFLTVPEVIKNTHFQRIAQLDDHTAAACERLIKDLTKAKAAHDGAMIFLRSLIFVETKKFLETHHTIETMEDPLSQRMIAEEIGNILECPEIVVTARMVLGKYRGYFLNKATSDHDISHKKTYQQLAQIEQQLFYFNGLEKKLTTRLDGLNEQLEQLNSQHANTHRYERSRLCNKSEELRKILNSITQANQSLASQYAIVEKKARDLEEAADALYKKRNSVIHTLFEQYQPIDDEERLDTHGDTENHQQLIDLINQHRRGIKKFLTRKFTLTTSKERIQHYLYKNGLIHTDPHHTLPSLALENIRLSLRNGLRSPKRYLVTDGLLSYLGMNPLRFSIRKTAEMLNKTPIATSMDWQKADKDIIAMMGLLRGAHRKDLIRLYFRTLNHCSKNENASEEAILKDFFSDLESLFMQLAYPSRINKAKTFSLYHLKGLDAIEDPARIRSINDKLYLNALKKRINHIFDRYGHTKRIKRMVKNSVPEYVIEDNLGITYEKKTIRNKKLFWKMAADAVTVLNTVGQAAFACWGLIVTGNPLFLLIFLAAFVTNFYLFLPAQRATFIDLFVQWNMNGLSTYKKTALILAFGASLLSGLFFAFMAYGGATALITFSGGSVLALAVGAITFIGFTSLLFAVFKSYIVNETYKATWNYIREELLFKGFMNMTMKQRLGYVLAWAIRVLVMTIAALAATLYVAATLGKCYDTVATLFPKMPSALNGVFSVTGGLIDMFFTLKSVLPITIALSRGITYCLSFVAKGIFNGTVSVIMHPIQSLKWLKNKIQGVFVMTPSKTAKKTVHVIEKPHDWDLLDKEAREAFLEEVGGVEDTLLNNPNLFILPFAKIAFYVLVVLFLVPVNAMGNALTNASSAPTLVDKLDAMGLHSISDAVLGKLIILASLICSASIAGEASHEETTNVTPDMDSEQIESFVFDVKSNRDALSKPCKTVHTPVDEAMAYFNRYMGSEKKQWSQSHKNNEKGILKSTPRF